MATSTKKKTTVYRCASCGHVEPKWLGRCPECGEWNTLRETAASEARSDRAGETFPLPIASIDPGRGARMPTGSGEVDRVLGGGLMRGSAVLLGGEPGIGKSTLLLQLCAKAKCEGRILYISGEESPAQIRLRADRLGALREGLEVFSSGSLEAIRGVLDAVKPVLVVVDSVQTLYADEAGAVPGTANQIKYCAQELTTWTKEHESALFLVAHVTKEGLIAGPKAAEHLVDAVLSFEQSEGELRVLRASKNRFGNAEEIGIFRMCETGLEEVADPRRPLPCAARGPRSLRGGRGGRPRGLPDHPRGDPGPHGAGQGGAHAGLLGAHRLRQGVAHRCSPREADGPSLLGPGHLRERGRRHATHRAGHRPALGRGPLLGAHGPLPAARGAPWRASSPWPGRFGPCGRCGGAPARPSPSALAP